ncbi:MAG TPA: hypothetical protein VM223_24345 [Planctomycetota bacterium]|nr:hypothetical protein [Planctomycetota bacterium]
MPLLWLAALAVLAPLAAEPAPPADKSVVDQIADLKAVENKSYDDLVRLALLSRKLHDEPRYEQWLAAAAKADPANVFTSDRSPFVYVRAWSQLQQDRLVNHVVREGGGVFHSVLSDGRVWGVTRIDPLLQDLRPIQVHEIKAEYASSLAAAYDQKFYLANQGIVFAFTPEADYLGQMVCMNRHKLQGSNTLQCVLDADTFYIADHYRHIGIMNWHADTLKRIVLAAKDASSTIARMDDDKDRYLFAAITGENAVAIIRPDLTERCRIGGSGTQRGQMLSIMDVSAANASFVTLDSSLRRIQVFDRNGAWLMDMPSTGFSLAIGDDGTILALEDSNITCYARLYKPQGHRYDPEFESYLNAVKLMEEGKPDEGRALLKPLTTSTDSNLAQVAASLMQNDTLALVRHYEKPRPLTDAEAVRLLRADRQGAEAVAGEPSRVFRDPVERCIWAATNGGFLRRIDECERVTAFDEFPLLHGLEGKLTVSDMRFDKDWAWAETSRGVCRYSRSDGDWQFVRTVKRLRDVR